MIYLSGHVKGKGGKQLKIKLQGESSERVLSDLYEEIRPLEMGEGISSLSIEGRVGSLRNVRFGQGDA